MTRKKQGGGAKVARREKRSQAQKKAVRGEGVLFFDDLEEIAKEIGESEGSAVGFRIEVLGFRCDRLRPFDLQTFAGDGAEGGHRKTPPSGRVAEHRREVEGGRGEDRAKVAVDLLEFFLMNEGGFALHDEDAPFAEGFPARCKEVFGDQASGRADRIRRVNEDHVVGVEIAGKPSDAVFKSEVNAGIIEAGREGRKELTGDLDDHFVKFDHVDVLDFRVAQKLKNGAAIASADHKDTFGMGMGAEGGMDEHFVIKKFVAFGEHDASVEDHHPAHPFGFKDGDLLVRTLKMTESFSDLIDQPEGLFVKFLKPKLHASTDLKKIPEAGRMSRPRKRSP